MPVKIVDEKDAPSKLFKGGVVTRSTDYNEVLTAIRTIPANKSIVLTMGDPELLKEDKPEMKLAQALRRLFDAKGLALTAYQSAAKEITIRKATALDATKGKGKK